MVRSQAARMILSFVKEGSAGEDFEAEEFAEEVRSEGEGVGGVSVGGHGRGLGGGGEVEPGLEVGGFLGDDEEVIGSEDDLILEGAVGEGWGVLAEDVLGEVGADEGAGVSGAGGEAGSPVERGGEVGVDSGLDESEGEIDGLCGCVEELDEFGVGEFVSGMVVDLGDDEVFGAGGGADDEGIAHDGGPVAGGGEKAGGDLSGRGQGDGILVNDERVHGVLAVE